MKKTLCLLAALLLLPCAAFGEHYYTTVDETAASDGTYLIAVNTNPSPTVTQQTEDIPAISAPARATAAEPSIPYGTRQIIETEAGRLYELEPERETMTAAARKSVQTTLLYANEVCEVYLDKAAAPELQFTKECAAQLGDYYRDFICQQMQQAFGALPDQQKKLKILCYDIEDDFDASDDTKWAYTAGMFDSSLYQNGHYAILLDTYPTMSFNARYPTKIQPVDVTKSYGTLAHEFQHLLNRCAYNTNDDCAKPQMATWLNECFSECANEIQDPGYSKRITGSNAASVSAQLAGGLSLMDWQSTLGNYTLSYLFGQYLRTQTKNYPGGGNGIYRKISEQYYTQPGSELDAVAAVMTEVTGDTWTPEELLFRFRVALTAQQKTGIYGFGGEEKFLQYAPAPAAGGTVTLPGGGATMFFCPPGYRVPSATDGDIRYCVVTPPDIIVLQAQMETYTKTVINSNTYFDYFPVTSLKEGDFCLSASFVNHTAQSNAPVLYAAIYREGALLHITRYLPGEKDGKTGVNSVARSYQVPSGIQPGDTLRVYALSGGLHPYMQTVFTFVQP